MTSFIYTRDIPNGPNDPSDDQGPMQTNTNSIDDLIAVDHVSFGAANGGVHKFVHLLTQSVNPAVTADFSVLFNKVVSGNTELFYRYGSAPQNVFQITNNGAIANDNGFSSLVGPAANPLKIVWQGTALDNNGVSIRNDSPFVFPSPFTTACYSVILSAEKASTGAEGLWVSNGTLTNLGFSIKTSASAGQFTKLYYIAIGS